MTASILQQLLALNFSIICSLQLSSSEKSVISREIFINVFQRFYSFRFLLHRYFFFHFFLKMPVYRVGYAKRMLYAEQSTVLLARRHLNTTLLTNFENINSISNIFQETHDFLVLKKPTSYMYRQTFS